MNLVSDISDKNYDEKAEKVINSLRDSKNKIRLTTSKIRSLLELHSQIYNILTQEKAMTNDIRTKIRYMKIRFVYEEGRDKTENYKNGVVDFIRQSEILEILDNILKESDDIQAKKMYMLFSNYFEALIAYRKLAGYDNN